VTRRVLALLTAASAVLALAPPASSAVAFCIPGLRCSLVDYVCEDVPHCVPDRPVQCFRTPDTDLCI
jgi:hypothetical protein